MNEVVSVDGSANWARWILYMRSDLSYSENPRNEADVTGVVINCTLCHLVTTLHTVEIDNLTAHRQDVRSDGQMIGVKSQKGDLNDSDQ